MKKTRQQDMKKTRQQDMKTTRQQDMKTRRQEDNKTTRQQGMDCRHFLLRKKGTHVWGLGDEDGRCTKGVSESLCL